MIAHQDASGPLVVGRLLGRGGEGEVFALDNDPRRAIKIYNAPDLARETKIRSMIRADLAASCTAAAFPQSVVTDTEGRFVGFTMDLVNGGQPIHELYSPASRRRQFQDADWRLLVRTAANVARAFGEVHAAGTIVGDVNGSGILVSPRAVATLIDADSFHYGSEHPCRVGVPEFTPPELQRRSLDGIQRTAEHDAFGLAVLIFHLLFLGRHPFAGVPEGREIQLPEAIRQNIFAYSCISRPRLRPPANTLLLSDLPLPVANLFEQAFCGLVRRPGPAEWVDGLSALEASLVTCTRNRSHGRPSVGKCAWCRIDAATAALAFGSPLPMKDRPTVSLPLSTSQSEAGRLLARAHRESGEGLLPAGYDAPSTGNPAALGTAIGRAAKGQPPVHTVREDPIDVHAAENANREAKRELDAALDDWRTRVGAWSTARLANTVAAEVDRQLQTAMRHASDVAGVDENLRKKTLRRELEKAKVEPNIAPGIGERSVSRLVDAGVVSAATITWAAVHSISGFGERGATLLLLWRDKVLIEIDRTIVVGAEDIKVALSNLRRDRQREQVDEACILDLMVSDLRAALDDLAVRAARPDARVNAAAYALDLARQNYRRRTPEQESALRPVTETSRAQPSASARRGSPLCPKCGGAMVRRWARRGSVLHRYFLGCAAYPACMGSRPLRGRTP